MPDTRQKTLWPAEPTDRVRAALLKLFSKHRIVFWYDAQRELRGEFEAVTLPDVEKVVVDKNEFGLKYRMLREQPESRFLLYFDGPQPPDTENWLLDVLLAHEVFRTDQAALWLASAPAQAASIFSRTRPGVSSDDASRLSHSRRFCDV